MSNTLSMIDVLPYDTLFVAEISLYAWHGVL